jgi:hypothetical protein
MAGSWKILLSWMFRFPNSRSWKAQGFSMSINKPRCFFLPVLLLLNAFLNAQTTEYTEFGSVQRLAWTADQYALRYEVLVEREEGDEYRRIAREFTDKPFIELSLPQGKYRYQVIPYNFFNRPAKGSEWKKIEIRAALNPELYYILPEIFYIGDDDVYTLFISGKGIESEAEFSLQGPGAASIVPYTKQILEGGSQARLFFNKGQLLPGVYELHVRNPSGLETRGAALTVAYPEPETEPEHGPEPAEPEVKAAAPAKPRPPLDIGISAAWMPLFPIYGENGLFFGNTPSLVGVAGRLDLVYSKPAVLNLGLEFAGSWYIFHPAVKGDEMSSDYIRDANAATLTLNFLAQKYFPNQAMSLRFRLGMGLTIPPDNERPPMAQNLYYPLLNMESFHASIGFSFLWYFQKHFYLESGLDYLHQFSEIPSGCFRPWIGLGLRF